MKVHVEFLGLHYAIKKSHLEVEFSGRTIAELVRHLSTAMTEFKTAVMTENGGLDETIQIGVNEEWITPDRMSETCLSDGDRVMFLMMAGGG